MLDLVVRGGRVVTAEGVRACDVGVRDGRIVSLGAPGVLREAARVIDATARIVLPGAIEPHAHLDFWISQYPDEELRSLGPEEATVGMAFGGVTTHIDFCWTHPGDALAETVSARAERWRGRSFTDYAFHVALLGPQPFAAFEQLPELVAEGFPSVKVFTNNVLPPHPRRRPAKLDAGRIALAMETLARCGGILAVHAEDDDIVQTNYERFLAMGRTDSSVMHLVHTGLSEKLAFARVIGLAESTGAAVYFVHTSARAGVAAIAAARARALPVYGETLHQYLCHDSSVYAESDGIQHHTYPSLKGPDDREALWAGLLDGTLSTTATDEVPTMRAVKLKGRRSDDVTGGNLGAEARVGIVYTEAVAKRGMSLERFADVIATNAARVLGLYPRKGVIAIGSDADLLVLDPTVRRVLGRADFHVADYSPWEGWEVRGWPAVTILRGRVMVEGGKLVGAATEGQLVRRAIDPEVLRRPVC